VEKRQTAISLGREKGKLFQSHMRDGEPAPTFLTKIDKKPRGLKKNTLSQGHASRGTREKGRTATKT